MERICVNSIKSGYRKKEVLKGISFYAKAGQCVGIVGPNGSGKTTLFQILSGLRKPDEGNIFFDGVAAEGKERRDLFIRYTGYVPQTDNLILELTVYDNLLLWYGSKDELQKAEKNGFICHFDIIAMYGLKVRELSMGMRKKVSIVCAMAGNPPILLLDEPDASLDLPGKEELRNDLSLFAKEGGTVIMSTHDETQLHICDKIYMLKQGNMKEVKDGRREYGNRTGK